jgi:hypothetical protein
MLLWLLEGLQRYHEIGFRTVPAICKEWRKELVGQQDTVTPWIEMFTEHTGNPDDFITRADAYESFQDVTGEQKCRKTAISKAVFWEKLDEAFGEPLARLKRGKDHYKVYLGRRLKSAE